MTEFALIGTFAEVGTLIRSFPQLMYDHIKDPSNDYWQWLLAIRQFLRFKLFHVENV